ncbi:MAG: septum formation initiator family protein [Firmicutes bacterium]|nr:septum formation initiator family protein [Bacillota bacterium]
MEHKRKVIFRSKSIALKIMVMVLIVFSMSALMALRWVHNGIQEQVADLRGEAAALEQSNSGLEEKIGELGSVKSVEDIARSELNLVNPNTIVIDVGP